MDMIRKALELVPDSAAYLDSLGWGYFKKGEYLKALKYIKQAYQKAPDDPVVTEHLAEVEEALGNKEEALKLYRKALEIIEKTGDEGEPGLKKRILEKIKELER